MAWVLGCSAGSESGTASQAAPPGRTGEGLACADDAAACKAEAAQATLTSGQCDLDPDHAYVTCLRRKGRELQQRP